MTHHLFRAVLAFTAATSVAYAQSGDPKPTPAPTTVDASSGGVTISSGVNSLTIGARAQVRFLYENHEEFDADRQGPGVGEADDPLTQFDVPRLRVTLSGGAFRPWFKYLFQFDFSRTSGESSSKIKDAILEFRPVGQPFRVQAGQFKAPFGLQQITSSGRLQFVERAITDAKFNPAREMGAMFSGTAVERKVGYDLGVFNRSGESVRETNSSPLWVGRVVFEPFGPYALSETAVDGLTSDLEGLEFNGHAGRQLELLPYVAAKTQNLSVPNGDPFNGGNVQSARAGLDLKYNLSSNVTLDATFNPDFGQVEADPAVVNLTAFETSFPEKRPFFIASSGVFGFGGFNCYFCSNVS